MAKNDAGIASNSIDSILKDTLDEKQSEPLCGLTFVLSRNGVLIKVMLQDLIPCAAQLQEKNVRYAVAGDAGLALHGVVRFVTGLSLIVHADHENVVRFISVLNAHGYQRVGQLREGNSPNAAKRETLWYEKDAKLLSFYHQSQSKGLIDVFIDRKCPYDEMEKNFIYVSSNGFAIPIVSLSDVMTINNKMIFRLSHLANTFRPC